MEVGGASFDSVAPQRIENNYAARGKVQPRRTDTKNNNAATRYTKIGKKCHLFSKKKSQNRFLMTPVRVLNDPEFSNQKQNTGGFN